MTAPLFRSVDQHTGEVADRPSKFMAALSEADNFVREIDSLRELQTRVQELEAERDDLADRLHSLRDAHRITLTELARARTERDDMRAEVSR